MTTRQLAEKVVSLYWRQPLEDLDGAAIRQTRTGKQAAILASVVRLREESLGVAGAGAGAERVRVQLPQAYERLVSEVEWKLIELPLPKLQRVGGQDTGWLYRIHWDDDAHRPSRASVSAYQRGQPSDFDNRILLRAEVAVAFTRLHGLLRSFIEQRWTQEVQRMSGMEHSDLRELLFGAQRSNLDHARAPLANLQRGDCFYCGRALDRAGIQVDHFIPWARYPDDGLSNLVAAHQACNGSKSDFLAAVAHLERWRSRNEQHGPLLAELADEHARVFDPERSLGAARALYLRLPMGARLWRGRDDFELLDPRAIQEVLA